MNKIIFAYIFSCILFIEICSAKLPTLYEYYTNNGNKIDIGLEANGPEFTLNHKPFVIYSGSLHYFRIVPEYWPQTLQKFKAAGLNTVQFYIPWNRHEPQPGQFDFDSYGLNLTEFLNEIRKADMFAIVRAGPFICAEWDLGGLPAWLLKDPHMSLRSLYNGYLEPVRKYFRKLFEILDQFQFTKNGGPIIALQVENELFGDPDSDIHKERNLKYLDELHQMIVNENHFEQLLFTSDNLWVAIDVPVRSLKYLLETANFNENASALLQLKNNQKNRPVFVSEFWPGMFDQWGDKSHKRYPASKFEQQISEILFQVNGSVNFDVFIGGTNFAFYNGLRVTTSYDFDAPLSESGNYTEKYYKTRELYTKLLASGRQPATEIPSKPPSIVMAKAYGDLTMKEYLNFEQIISQMKPIVMKQALFMEFIDNSSGFGFILYRLKTKPIQTLNITGPIKDRAIIMINGKILTKIEDGAKNLSIHLKNPSEWFANSDVDEYNLDILVENLGRADYNIALMNKERRGINSTILLDGNVCNEIHTYTFDFNQNFMKSTVHSKWNPITTNDDNDEKGTRLYRTQFQIESNPTDTFMKLPGWTYGNVFINNFNIGRFDYRGPQKTLYIPGPLLRSGENVIHIFELDKRGSKIQLIDHPIWQQENLIFSQKFNKI